MEKQNGRLICTTTELADILDLSERRVQQLTKSEVLRQTERGKYDIAQNVQTFFSQRIESAKNDYQDEKTKLIQANRKKAEIELAIMNDEVFPAAAIIEVMTEQNLAFRARILAIPKRLAPLVMAETELMKVQEIIKKECYDALTELASYKPGIFKGAKKGNNGELTG
jgi:hypothetical protein